VRILKRHLEPLVDPDRVVTWRAERLCSAGCLADRLAGDTYDLHALIARLTGAPGPDVTCEQCFEELDRYVELELAGSGADPAIPGMRAHLEGCSACAEDGESLRALLLSDASQGV
jgi:hypothetical protein